MTPTERFGDGVVPADPVRPRLVRTRLLAQKAVNSARYCEYRNNDGPILQGADKLGGLYDGQPRGCFRGC